MNAWKHFCLLMVLLGVAGCASRPGLVKVQSPGPSAMILLPTPAMDEDETEEWKPDRASASLTAAAESMAAALLAAVQRECLIRLSDGRRDSQLETALYAAGLVLSRLAVEESGL